MGWLIPDNKLDSSQLEFLRKIEESNDNFLITGYAGCGKTILLVYSYIRRKQEKSNIIFVTYTHALIDMINCGVPKEVCKDIPIVTYFKFQKMSNYWDIILVDEAQDIPKEYIEDIKNKGKRIIIVGDQFQSIYDNRCDFSTIENILSIKETFNLPTIYRISRKIRNIAQSFCGDSVGFRSASMGKLAEYDPRLVYAPNYDEECKWLIQTSKEYAQQGYQTAILIPNHREILSFLQKIINFEKATPFPPLPEMNSKNRKIIYETINAHLKSIGIKFQYLGNEAGSFKQAEKENLVTIMTYHSAKGLDYKAVFIPFLSSSLEIWRDNPLRERTLFFVALTRSREQLFLSYNGEKHRLLAEINENNFHKINASDEIAKKERKTIIDNDDITWF